MKPLIKQNKKVEDKIFSMDEFNFHTSKILDMLKLLPPFLSQQSAWARLAECHMWVTHAVAELKSVKEKEAEDEK